MLKITYWLRWVLFPAGLALATWLLIRLIDPEEIDLSRYSWGWFAFAFSINLVYVVIYGLIWHRVTLLHGIAVNKRVAVAAYLFSNLGKYVPLKVVGIAYRVTLYSYQYGKDAGFVVRACYVETLSAILAGVMMIIALLPFVPTLNVNMDWRWYSLVGVLLLIMLLPNTQRLFLGIAFRLLKKEFREPKYVKGGYSWLVFQYALAWLVLGSSLFVLCVGVGVVPSINNFMITSEVYFLAGVAGILVFVMPSGIGVREGVMLVGLSSIMSGSDAALVTILARISITLAEMVAALFAFVYLEFSTVGEFDSSSFQETHKDQKS